MGMLMRRRKAGAVGSFDAGAARPTAMARTIAAPSPTAVPTRHDVWVRMLLYPRHTLPTAAAPVLVGTALAIRGGVFAPGAALLAFLAGWLVQLGGVFADSYNNLRRHPDDEEHAAFVAAIAHGVVSMTELRAAIAACYAAAVAAGLWLAWVGGLPVLVLGLAAMAASLAYSAEPLALGDRGLGDPLFFLFFGPVSVFGAWYVQAAARDAVPPLMLDGLPATVLAAGVAMGALITGILVIDNIRDRDYDAAKGEVTVAVLIGPTWSRVEYVLLTAAAYLVPLVLARATSLGAAALLPLLSLPYAALVAARVCRARAFDELLPLTPQAGQVALLWAALFAIGTVW